MARTGPAYLAFNRGLISRLGIGRADVKRVAISAQTMTNWVPRVLGSMMLRPGLAYLGSTLSDAAARFLPFVFSISDKALIELTALFIRIWVSDEPITRVAVTTTVANPTMAASLANWTDQDEAGAASSFDATGHMQLVGSGTAAAIREQAVTLGAGSSGLEHALRITILRGPVTFRVGSSSGGDQYISEIVLGTGSHSLAFTPTTTFYVSFRSTLLRKVFVYNCDIEAAGAMSLPAPWPVGVLGDVRSDESADVTYLACAGYQQRKIVRSGTRSWGIELYQPEDGPFRIENIGPITITPSVINGNGTLTASSALFKSSHEGALFASTSTGQTVSANLALLNDVTNSIAVTGVGTDRTITVVISGITAGRTIALQRSFDNSTWVTTTTTYAVDGATAFTDGLDNQIVYYRLRLTVLGAAGTTVGTLSIPTGSVRGICRITAFTSSTVVDMEVLRDFGGTTATDTWEEGRWSDYRGWPSAVALYEGRLAWAGKDSISMSVSDGFESFDQTLTGDSAPIDRTIGSGPVDTINWILPLQRMVLGGQGAEFSCRSTSFDEPLTPTNFNIKRASTQGSGAVSGAAIDTQGIYVQRGGQRVYELTFDNNSFDYGSAHLSAMVPEIGYPSITRMAVQRQPDTRVHFVRSDGTVAMLVFDKNEDVKCWVEIETPGATGLIEDVVVLPGASGAEEDQVYYVVNRTIGGATKRFLERWALESECVGGSLNKQADSFITYSGTAVNTISGLGHLEGEEVVVWADGADVGTDDSDSTWTQTYTVISGAITLEDGLTVENAVVGLGYEARWRSAKLAVVASEAGLVLLNYANIKGLGMILADVHPRGLRFGPDFDNMDDMPAVEAGAVIDPDTMREEYDSESIAFPGEYDSDSRLCLLATAPRPVTALAVTIEVDAYGT